MSAHAKDAIISTKTLAITKNAGNIYHGSGMCGQKFERLQIKWGYKDV